MDIQQAIEKLKSLPPEQQARLIERIEAEPVALARQQQMERQKPYAWIDLLIQNPIHGDRTDLSEHPDDFIYGDE